MLSTSQSILFIILPLYLLLFSAGYLIARWNRAHEIVTLGLRPRALSPSIGDYVGGLRTLLGILVFLIFLPLLPIIALLSIPLIKIAGLIQRRREAEFAERIRHLGRAMSWAGAEQQVIAKEGTLICEILWMNGAPVFGGRRRSLPTKLRSTISVQAIPPLSTRNSKHSANGALRTTPTPIREEPC